LSQARQYRRNCDKIEAVKEKAVKEEVVQAKAVKTTGYSEVFVGVPALSCSRLGWSGV
jgi:hypothetical protein